MFRIGFGYDSHRLTDGRKFILGGIEIPHSMGLYGHSDADVLIHAVIDSIFGALADGDIGRHFPDTDAKYKNVSSVYLLEETVKILESKNYKIVNTDSTIICEKPKLKDYIESIRENISTILKTEKKNVSIKAKTNEKMDSVGREEGIVVNSVILIERSINTNELEEYEKEYKTENFVVECNIDDMTGEALSYAAEKIISLGAYDVWFSPIVMKKSRPAYVLNAIVGSEKKKAVIEAILNETTTLGVRIKKTDKVIIKPEIMIKETKYGKVRFKKRISPNGKEHYKVEYEDVKTISFKNNINIDTLTKELYKYV